MSEPGEETLPLERPAGDRAGPVAGRAVLRSAARRLRRRGDQGRAAGPGRPDARVGPGETARQVAVVAGGGQEQEVGHLQPAVPGGPGPAAQAARPGRRPGGELPARHAGALGAVPRGALAGQPGPGHHPGDRLRAERSLRPPGRLRRDRRGHGRHQVRDGAARGAAGPGRHLARRRARGHLRLPGHPGRPASPGALRARPGRGLRHLRGRPGHDGVAAAGVGGRGLPAGADRRGAAQRVAQQRVPDRRRGPGADRGEPGLGLHPARGGHGAPGAGRRPPVRHALGPRRGHDRAGRPHRGLDRHAPGRRPARPPARGRGARRADLPGPGHVHRPALRGAERHRHRRAPRLRRDPHAERRAEAVRHPRSRPVGRPGPGGAQRPGLGRAWSGSTRPSSPGCGPPPSSDQPPREQGK